MNLKAKINQFTYPIKIGTNILYSLPKEISKLIEENFKTEIGPSAITIKKDINKIGEFEININLHSEVQTKIFIKIDK